MKIYGPYIRKDNRQHVIIIYEDGSRKTKSYPRYLLEQHLNRELLDHETVDHIDGDFTNNSIDNLQLLSLRENVIKSIQPAEYLNLACKCCGKEFKRRKVVEDRRINIRKMDGPFCSKSCVGKTYN